MKNQEEILLGSIVKKGKRTKRPRTATTHRSTQTSPVEETPSASGSGYRDCLTEDDEEMANCLILLSQGPTPTENPPVQPSYECKTCNKSFYSFQALGGHRASHKKLKILPPPGTEEQNNTTAADASLHMSGPAISLPSPSVIGTGTASTSAGTGSKKVNKIHECSMCGAEFNSGQALGGHMRRHRPLVVAPPEILVQEVVKKEKMMLGLDLNLPAPFEEEESGDLVNGGGEAFPLEMENNTGSVGQPQLFTSSLIDCHY